MLPFQLEDAMRRVENQELEDDKPHQKEEQKEGKEGGDKLAIVK